MNMKTKNRQWSADYSSPQVQVLTISPEAVLCSSGVKDNLTGNTGSNWYEGEDAEW